jgi:hypothetical protein
VITNINQAKEFFRLLSPLLYPPSASTVLNAWLGCFARAKKVAKNHCIHLETPPGTPIIFRPTSLQKGEKVVIPVMEGSQCFCGGEQCSLIEYLENI